LINLHYSKYSKCPALARIHAWRRLRPWSLVSGIVNNSMFQSSQSDAASEVITFCTFHFYLVGSLLNYAHADFVVDLIEVGCAAATNLA